ncbi:hypothetical protein B0H10DRAFT_2230917 [Mycena sp. CBHHK59/15]|nr:hypothetical protein B0H10DRAFT_2230917 [Mycena sp. CBHHK59/15]
MPEFDPEITGKTWNAAKDQLLLLYGHSERVPDYTETMLRDFCEKQSAKPSFVNMADIEVYYRAFALIAVPLVKKAKISTKERDFYFIAGIPKVIKDWFLTQVPDAKRKRSDPPSVAESIGYLKKRFDDDSLTFEPWTEDAKASPIPHELSSAVTTNHLSAVDDLARQLERLTSAPTASVPTTPSNPVDELARQLERLALQLTTFSAFSALAERRHVNRSLIHDRVVEISPLAYTASPLVQKVHQALDIEWDSKHALKTFRNNLFSGAKLLPLGSYTAIYARIREMAFEDGSPLFHRDVEKLDRQDDNAATRLFSADTLKYLTDHHPEYLGEIVYLFVFGELIDAYQNRSISHAERVKLVLRARYFLDSWSSFLDLAGYSKSLYFLSREAVDIVRIIIEGYLALIYVHRDHIDGIFPLLPWLHSSEACEHIFGESRRIVKDFTMLDFLYMIPKLRAKLHATVVRAKASN